MSILLRVRTQIGLWRVKDVELSSTVADLLKRLEKEHSTDLSERPLTRDAAGEDTLDEDAVIAELGLSNGDMLHLNVDPEKTSVQKVVATAGMKVTKDGNIVQVQGTVDKKGFRPGMMPLRNMKMQWRLDEFLALDEQFVFNFTKMKDKNAFCEQVSLDTASMADLTQYMYLFDYRKIRIVQLWGHFTEGNKVRIEAMYEPPQETTDTEFNFLDDEKEEKVAVLAAALGLKKVGWLVVHPPREADFVMSGLEALTAAELQLEAADGVNDTCFVTLMATLRKMNVETDEDKPERMEWRPAVDGFQTHKLCMEMVAEGALDLHSNPGFCKVNDTFTAMAEGKEIKEVPTQLMVAAVPIVDAESTTFVSLFPKANREGVSQTREDLKKQLSMEGKGWTTKQLLTDFHLLLFLCDMLTMDDIPALCASLLDPDAKLEAGNLLLIRSIAGFDM